MGDEVIAFTSQRRQRVHDGRAGVIIVGVVAFIAATFGLALPASAAPPIKAVTTTAVGASPNAGVGVAGVLLYASVAPNTAGGTVAFTDGTTVVPGCAARPVNADSASFGYASCVTTFATPGTHTITVTYAGDATHIGSAGTITLTVTATPDFFQIALGLLYNFLRTLNLFGLNPINAGPTPPPISTAPVYTGDFPDPSVVLDGSTYYAFATQGNGVAVQRLTSPDRLHWNRTAQPDALLAVPSWADTLGTWAPEVQLVGGQYVMYYTVHMRNSVECISIATSASPAQQFVDHSSAPLICQVPGGGSIDPSPFLSPTGERFLTWKSNLGGASTLLARKMAADGTSFAPGNQVPLLQSTAVAWAPSNIEGPSMVFHEGQYLLFYSGNVYTSPTYGIGYAVCATPLGPCTNSSTTAPWVGTHGDARGPGGQSFFTDATGTLVMGYHAWWQAVGYENGGVRAFWTDTVHFTDGLPTLG